MPYKKVHLNDNNDEIKIDNKNLNNDNLKLNIEIHNNIFNRTLIVGPSFCGKTQLILNKLQIFQLDNPEKQIKIITRSPEQYSNFELGDTGLQAKLLWCVSVEVR